jgi:hypothetical protein
MNDSASSLDSFDQHPVLGRDEFLHTLRVEGRWVLATKNCSLTVTGTP